MKSIDIWEFGRSPESPSRNPVPQVNRPIFRTDRIQKIECVQSGLSLATEVFIISGRVSMSSVKIPENSEPFKQLSKEGKTGFISGNFF
jgi:hypothetical protein